MSRKYCSKCGNTHSNGGLGMCDSCLILDENKSRDEQNEKHAAWTIFNSQTTEDQIYDLWEALIYGKS